VGLRVVPKHPPKRYTDSKKIYRRADIIELMKTDPRRYQSMEPEIRKAYMEKRVR
jgi:hypothetical protein